MKKTLVPALFALLLTGLIAPLFGQTSENSLLWEISGKGLAKPSYLFGTYHLLNDSYLSQKNPAALAAFQKADGVVVEVVLDTASMMRAQIGMLMPYNRLSQLLDSADYQLVKAELSQTAGIDIAAFEQVKPMAIATMLTIAYTSAAAPELTAYTGEPLDRFFASNGAATGKKVQGLETLDEQIDLLFNHFSQSDQARLLVDFIKIKVRAIEAQKSLTQYYFSQDIQALYELNEKLTAEMPSWGDMDFITTDRNKRWVEKLPAILSAGNQFIAVGALHLPGPDGLIDLLKKQGYTVKAIK